MQDYLQTATMIFKANSSAVAVAEPLSETNGLEKMGIIN